MNRPTPTIRPDGTAPNGMDGSSSSSPADAPAPNRLDAILSRLRAQVGDRLDALLDGLEADLFAPLQSAAHEAAAIHAALVKTSHFDRPVGRVEPPLRGQRVRDYRRDTMARVVTPLRDTLRRADIAGTLDQRWTAFWDDLATLPTQVPVAFTRPEPDALYTPSADDAALTALRKRWVQLRRRLPTSITGDASGPRTQQIPLRHLYAYHLRMRLPRQLAPLETTLHQHFAQAVAAFERAVTTWTHRVLDAERQLHRPIDHLPTPLQPDASSMPRTDDPAVHPPLSPPNDTLDPADAWRAVHAESETLNQELHRLATLGFDACAADARSTLQTGWRPLQDDTARADSFMLDLSDRTISPDAPHDQRPTPPGSAWAPWYEQVADRLAFCQTLADVRDAADQHCETLLHRLLDTSVQPLLTLHTEARDRLQTLHDEATALFAAPTDLEALSDALTDLRRRALTTVEDQLVAPLQAARLLGTTADALRAPPMPTGAFFDDHPAVFQLHALPEPDAPSITPEDAVRTVDLHAIVQEHFDSFFAEALREALHPFQQRLETALSTLKDIPTILLFNLDEAQAELTEEGEDEEDAVAAARELTLNGLGRSVEAIDAQIDHAHASIPYLISPLTATFAAAWIEVHDRARVESRIREHLMELRALVDRETQEASERAERRFRAARIGLKRAFRLGRGRAEKLLQRSRTAVGAGGFREDAFLETLEALALADDAFADLPLVYRRLFAFRPLTNPALLAGRQADLTRIQRHLDQWEQGLTNAMVLTGSPGSGLTSFLNVIQRTTLRRCRVHWASLDERLHTESAVARRLARALHHPLADEEEVTLDALRAALQAEPRPDPPRVCFIEHLEHLFLRTVNGTQLAHRVLTFLSRTDAQVVWMATLSHQGWQLLDRAASAASGLVLHHTLTPIDREALETLILNRHQRSGLQLHFEPPEDPNPILKQRLRQGPSPDAQREILRTQYFDRLYDLCGSNIMLALFYWTRSVQLDEDAMVMRVRGLHPLDFTFLERFSTSQAFLLKSLLDHATLTVEEYSDVAQLPLDTCFELFESLGNALLIQPADAQAHDAASLFTAIESGRRYRVRPLVIHPVLQYLRSENIVH